jgi:hypothetical protein
MARGGGGRIGNSGNGGNSNFPLFGFLAGESLANSGGSTLSVCGPNDNTYYCEFVRDFNIFKMILFILFILFIIGYGIYYFIQIFKLTKRSKSSFF